MAIVLYNSLRRAKQKFEPLNAGRVTMYLCGPTVYNYAHIGNARPAVVFGLLVRLLELEYPEVVFARNVTDVEDKINAAAEAEGVPIETITKRYTQAYHEDMRALGVRPPTVEPHATAHMDNIIAMIDTLVAKGFAYQAEGHVLFSVTSFADYGVLSGRNLREMIAGARVEVAPYKKDPSDFVLWKPSQDPQPGWDSPWGFGRPGWHIECSAMAAAHLGETIDIHAGGQDLIFPHHENELAQSQCAHGGKPFARYWLHNGFVTVEKRKMSKSLGNTLIIRDLLKKYSGETLRYVLLSAHYRQPLDWSNAALAQADRTLDRMYAALQNTVETWGPCRPADKPTESFLATLEDDLNTPKALAEINSMARQMARAEERDSALELAGQLLACAGLLSLLQQSPQVWFSRRNAKSDVDEAQVEELIARRNEARNNKDYSLADQLRDKLLAMGIQLEDRAGKTHWKRNNPQ